MHVTRQSLNKILRYDVCLDTSLPQINTSSIGLVKDIRIRPGGEFLVISDAGGDISLLSSSGLSLRTYDIGEGENWVAISLDPDGTSFWAGEDGGTFYKFDIESGDVLLGPILRKSPHLTAMAVAGEIRAATYDDQSPPDTFINKKKDGNGNPMHNNDYTNSTTVSMSFYGKDNVTPSHKLKYECRLDNSSESAFSLCDRPITLSALSAGKHTFEVRGTDKAGNKDPTPASFTWIVDTSPPVVKLSSKLDGDGQPIKNGGSTTSTTAKFSFYAVDDNTKSWKHTFKCRLDSNSATPWLDCTRPEVFNGLSVREHTFEVAAVDLAGNWSNTLLFSWNVTSP
jgi:hypothetical protein